MKLSQKHPSQVRFVGHGEGPWNRENPKVTKGKVYPVERANCRGSHGFVWIRNDLGQLVVYSARGFERTK